MNSLLLVVRIFKKTIHFLSDLQLQPGKCLAELFSEKTTESSLKNYSFPAAIDVYIRGKAFCGIVFSSPIKVNVK